MHIHRHGWGQASNLYLLTQKCILSTSSCLAQLCRNCRHYVSFSAGDVFILHRETTCAHTYSYFFPQTLMLLWSSLPIIICNNVIIGETVAEYIEWSCPILPRLQIAKLQVSEFLIFFTFVDHKRMLPWKVLSTHVELQNQPKLHQYIRKLNNPFDYIVIVSVAELQFDKRTSWIFNG